MKFFIIILVFCVFSAHCNLGAQENLWYEKDLSDYTEYIVTNYGINFKPLDKFIDLNKFYVLWSSRKDSATGFGNLYGPIFISKMKDCIIMYSAQPNYISQKERERLGIVNCKFPRSQITGEIKSTLGLYFGYNHPFNIDTVNFDFNDYVTSIVGKIPNEMFNADSIFIYDLPDAHSGYFFDESLEKMRTKKFTYCTGMFICKNSRATMEIKFFFTEKGVKKKNKYIEMLNKNIWYNDKFHY